ncbi:Glycosyltransferase involved in cell wall bisynthesis [Alteromonadaceae bacterium Bs31]|nr:Glycosyltransferase involved in cell wall bisynthesis [Alteromonadaceae bacterium Bs31]
MDKHPLVSVIMPAYNSSDTILESIQSVVQQSYTNWELLVTDDNSTDDTVSKISKIQNPKIKLFRFHRNQGAGAARNNSIKNAQGEYIAFLDADDLWDKCKLELQICFMQKNNYVLSYTAYKTFDKSGAKGVATPPNSVTFDQLIYSNVIGCLTAMYDAKSLGKRYMPTIRKRQDMGLWLDILKSGHTAHCLTKPLASYRLDNGMTKNKLKIVFWQWKFYRETLSLTIFSTLKIFVVYALRGTIKTIRSRMPRKTL